MTTAIASSIAFEKDVSRSSNADRITETTDALCAPTIGRRLHPVDIGQFLRGVLTTLFQPNRGAPLTHFFRCFPLRLGVLKNGPWRPTSARCNPELAKGLGARWREGSRRRSDGGDRTGLLSPIWFFRFAGHDAHGPAAYIACAPSAGECLRLLPRILQLEKKREVRFQRGRPARNQVVFINLGGVHGREGKALENRAPLTWPYALRSLWPFPSKGRWLPPGASR